MALDGKLRELEEELRRQAAPVVDCLAAGRSPSSTRAALDRAFGLVPEEIVTWFAWHDGIVLGMGVDWTLGLYRPQSLQEALRKPLYEPFLEQIGGPALPLFSNDSDTDIAARLDVDPVTTPMFLVNFKDAADETTQRTASLEGLIDAWLELFATGYQWNSQEGGWACLTGGECPTSWRVGRRSCKRGRAPRRPDTPGRRRPLQCRAKAPPGISGQ